MIIAFLVVVGLVGLLPRLVVVWVVGRAVVQDGIGVVILGGFHGIYGVVVVTGTSSAQEALQ